MGLCERNSSAFSKASGEGGGEGGPASGAEIALQPWSVVQTMVSQDVPLQHMGVHGEAEIHLQEPHTREGGFLKQAVSHRRLSCPLPLSGAGKGLLFLRRKQQQKQHAKELTVTTLQSWQEKGRQLGIRLGKEGGVGRRCLWIYFPSSLSDFDR